jgi:hypothetical protein
MVSCINFASFLFHHLFLVHTNNKCPDFELVPLARFDRDVTWHIPPDQEVNANNVAITSFTQNTFKCGLAGASIYRLQKKKIGSNVDNTHAKNTSTSIQLLVIWGPNYRYEVSVRALLIKHSNTIAWDEDRLERLYSTHLSLLKNGHIVKDTWLLDDATVLMTMSKWKEKSHTIKAKVTISKGARGDNSMEPLWVSSDI